MGREVFDKETFTQDILIKKQEELTRHSLYKKLDSIENIRIFMEFHIFAVWDFMSLLKSLQRTITCIELPWKDSQFDPKLVRLINEIVLAEESDVDQNGVASSHFKLYLRAMEEVGADASLIKKFLKSLDFSILPKELSEVISYHLDLAHKADVHEVASSFFFGREKLIPEMFESIVLELNNNKLDCPTLIYYLKRHIELDGDDHGPKAFACLQGLIKTEKQKAESISTAKKSLEMRTGLWDFIEAQIEGCK